MIPAFFALMRRDLRLALRQSADLTAILLFFLMAATLFPLAVGPDPAALARIAPGVVWALALLAVVLSLERLFHDDYRDGALELIALGAPPLPLVALARMAAHFCVALLPLTAAAAPIALLLNLPAAGYTALLAGLALGAPTLCLIGGAAAALTLGARRAGPLTALLTLPLFAPVLIFGVAAVDAALTGMSARPHLLLLGAMLALALAAAPFAAAAAIRQALE